MKRILITGANSYIGTSLDTYLKNCGTDYAVDTVDMIDIRWREKSFAGYDVVFHVAGIVHQKETADKAALYYAVNRDLAVETAKKAKAEGVSQFIFMSTMSLYGTDTGVITPDTVPAPKSHYGTSKWQAEQALNELRDDTFAVAILRPPMVYGKGCPGNFHTVTKLVQHLPFFPRLHNARSQIHIDNLCCFLQKCIDKRLDGLYFPQNRTYMDTIVLAQTLAQEMGKELHLSALVGLGVRVLRLFLPIAKKGFGTLIYQDTEVFDFDYCIVDTVESIQKSV